MWDCQAVQAISQPMNRNFDQFLSISPTTSQAPTIGHRNVASPIVMELKSCGKNVLPFRQFVTT